jgi:hypothetical protein
MTEKFKKKVTLSTPSTVTVQETIQHERDMREAFEMAFNTQYLYEYRDNYRGIVTTPIPKTSSVTYKLKSVEITSQNSSNTIFQYKNC